MNVLNLFKKMIEVISRLVLYYKSHRGVEQLVARRAHNPKVAGSNPVPATILRCQFIIGAFFYALKICRNAFLKF